MIKLQSAGLRRGPKVLFQNTNLTIHKGEKVGLVGANGCGKSSLFALLLGQLELDTGDLQIADVPLAYSRQTVDQPELSILDYVLLGDQELHYWQQAYQQALDSHDDQALSRASDELDKRQAWRAEPQARQLLSGLGFMEESFSNQVHRFSGGWQMRLNLARALMQPSEILLLDEPTNHLDLNAILWLESWLKQYQGTLLLISHDRIFLDRMVNQIVHFRQQELLSFKGNYSAFEKQLAEQIRLQSAQQQKLRAKQQQLQQFIDRFRAKASKAKQAQSRIKQLEKLDDISVMQSHSLYHFAFQQPEHQPNPIARLESVTIGYTDLHCAENINLIIQPGDRLGILGINGAGKSTLLKTLVGDQDALSGETWLSDKANIGYFDQHQMQRLPTNDSAFSIAQRQFPNWTEQGVLDYLGRFAFSGDEAHKPSGQLSGGERSRLLLGLIMAERPNLLILDEPTNHLDLEAREALMLALQDFEGAIILVSHDRHLVATTCDQLYLLAKQRLQQYSGNLEDYVDWVKQEISQQGTTTAKVDNRKQQRQAAAQKRQAAAPIRNRIKQIEADLSLNQKKLEAIEQQLSESTIYDSQNKPQLRECLIKQGEYQAETESLEVCYLDLLEQLEAFEQD